MIDDQGVAAFESSGFVVLRGAFDADRLSREVADALAHGYRGAPPNTGGAGNTFRYVPMMCEWTPVSLALLDALAVPAAQLLGRPALPVRAKGTRYLGGTAWHRDSELDICTLGLAAYLEPLDAGNGALRILPGSHTAVLAESPNGLPDDPIGGFAIASEPGDVIAFDERLWHASAGGVERRQWRVDFIPDPATPEEEAKMRGYLAAIFQPGWDGGYDVDRYPSYGDHVRASGRRWVDRLRHLGAVERADQEEAAVRLKRQRC